MTLIAVRAGLIAALLLALVPASAPAALTATGARIGSHPAFVRVVVEFSGGTLQLNNVEATDPRPIDGLARVELRQSGVTATALVASAHGVRVRMSRAPGRVLVRLESSPRTFKYLRTTSLPSPQRLVLDLYRARPPVTGANIPVGTRSCLTLESVTRVGRSFRLRGIERDLFEGSFVLRVRDASGRVVGARVMTARGDWTARVFYRVDRAQPGTVEAVADSAKDGALACLVQRRVELRP